MYSKYPIRIVELGDSLMFYGVFAPLSGYNKHRYLLQLLNKGDNISYGTSTALVRGLIYR